MSKRRGRKKEQVVGFLGVGLDNNDGDKRLTTSEHFLLVGGSEKTHERMQDTAIRFTNALRERGKKLEEASKEEIVDLLREAQE